MKKPDWADDVFVNIISGTLPFFLVISYVVPFVRMIARLVSEKQTKVKQSMKMMGMSDSAFWVSYYFTYTLIYVFLALLNTILLSIRVFANSNQLIIFLFFWLFGMASLASSVFLSTFFSSFRMAAIIGILWYFVTYIFCYFFYEHKLWVKELVSLLPNAALIYGT